MLAFPTAPLMNAQTARRSSSSRARSVSWRASWPRGSLGAAPQLEAVGPSHATPPSRLHPHYRSHLTFPSEMAKTPRYVKIMKSSWRGLIPSRVGLSWPNAPCCNERGDGRAPPLSLPRTTSHAAPFSIALVPALALHDPFCSKKSTKSTKKQGDKSRRKRR